jgi:sensor domain CHASE-containing protein
MGTGVKISKFWTTVKTRPSLLVSPILLTLILWALSYTLIFWGKHENVQNSRDKVASDIDHSISLIKSSLNGLQRHCEDIVEAVAANPQWPNAQSTFSRLATRLLTKFSAEYSLKALLLAPNAVVQSAYPSSYNSYIGLDTIKGFEPFFLEAIKSDGTFIAGPFSVVDPVTNDVIQLIIKNVIRLSPVDRNESFGLPPTRDCDLCYDDATNTRVWGTIDALVNLSQFFSLESASFAFLYNKHYTFRLISSSKTNVDLVKSGGQGGGDTIFDLDDPVEVSFELFNQAWSFIAKPEAGWVPSWFIPLLVAMPLGCIAVGGLLLCVLVSRAQFQMLLQAIVPADVIHRIRTENEYLLPAQHVQTLEGRSRPVGFKGGDSVVYPLAVYLDES